MSSDLHQIDETSLHDLATAVNRFVADVLDQGQERVLASADVSLLMTSVCRLYAALFDGAQGGPPPADLMLSPTEAVNAAAALLRSQQLTPFEFAIWFSGGLPLTDV